MKEQNLSKAESMRAKFEEKYADDLIHYRVWSSPKPNFFTEKEAHSRWMDSAYIVTTILESDYRKHSILYHLAIPIDIRLNYSRNWEEKNPPKPVNTKQVKKAIRATDEDIQGQLHSFEYAGIDKDDPFEEVTEEDAILHGYIPVFMNRLKQRRDWLVSQLPENDREIWGEFLGYKNHFKDSGKGSV
jgi:hypothetical protein